MVTNDGLDSLTLSYPVPFYHLLSFLLNKSSPPAVFYNINNEGIIFNGEY